jgi:AraC family transcriptional regulator of adaptative response/methylated-DNA-[protein]-cysteine methyltransferase
MDTATPVTRVTIESAEVEDEERWAAVVDRDGGADTGWVYGVRTTGIYCRPDCPSRRPKRENVAFYASPADARAGGLRACRRCRPDEAAAPDPGAELVAATCRLIELAPGVPTLEVLAGALGVSRFHLQRVFTERTGVSPRAYAERLRAERVAERLADGAPVSDAAYDAGFGSVGRLSAGAPGRLGMTPSRYRAGGAGEVIRVAVGETTLGPVLVAATDRGVCAIELGDDADELLVAFQDRFHAADIRAGDERFEELVAHVVGLVEHPSTAIDLPLDVRGTAFQERVWQALRSVPPGATTTYREVAEAIGSPTSVRAVAGACAANHVAIAIPCHRVVRTDGGLSGYRWGVERKRALLEREGSLGQSRRMASRSSSIDPTSAPRV